MATGSRSILQCTACGTQFRMTPSQQLALPGNSWACKQCGHVNGTTFRPSAPPLPPSPFSPQAIATQPFNPLARASRSRPILRWTLALLLLALLAAVGFGVFAVATGSRPLDAVAKMVPAKLAPALDADPDRQLVRAWFKENLNDPDWEEVRWWPVRDTGDIRDKNIEICKAEVAKRTAAKVADRRNESYNLHQIEMAQFELDVVTRNPVLRLVRVKYRTKILGANTLMDDLFVLHPSHAERVTELQYPYAFHFGRRDLFPDHPP